MGLADAHGSHIHSHPNVGSWRWWTSRCSNGAQFRGSIGWSFGECSTASSNPWSSVGPCTAEMVLSSLTRAQRSAPKKETQSTTEEGEACETGLQRHNRIKETSSSTNEAFAQTNRARFYKVSSPCSFIHIRTDTSLHLYTTTFRSHDSSSHGTWHHERATIHCSVTHSLRLKNRRQS